MDANTSARADTLPRTEKLVPTDAEEYLIRCAEMGEKWEPRDLARHNRNKDNITSSYGVPPSCVIRASLIRSLLTGAPWFADGRPLPINPKGLWIEHAYIADTLDLQGCHLLVPLWMKACALARGVRLRDATTQTIGFNTSLVGLTPQTPDFDPQSIDAVRARVNGKLYLADGFHAFGEVNFASARIAGQMECRAGHFQGSEADRDSEEMVALRCDAIEVEDSVLLTGGFTANAKVDFEGARITSSFDCSGGHFQCADQTPGQEPSATIALNGAAMRVGVDIKLGRYAATKFARHPIDFKASGQVVISGTRVGGGLDCQYAQFNAVKNAKGAAYAFYSDGLCTRGDADFRESKTSGTIRLRGAHIGGSLRCTGANITSLRIDEPKTFALDCIGITINACVFLNDGFVGTGGIDFRSAAVRESVDCSRGTFIHPGNPKYASEGFTALRLSYASIGAGLYMAGIKHFDGCLNLEHAEAQTIQDDGSAWLPQSKTQPNHPMTDIEALSQRLQFAIARQWKKEMAATKDYLKTKDRLDRKVIRQEIPLGSCFIKLDGFRYQRYVHPLLGDDRCSKVLIAWLRCQPTKCKWEDFRPQPWHQLSGVMKSMGHKVFSNRIAVAYNALAAKRPYGRGLMRLAPKIGHVVVTWFSKIGGYGYMPFRTLWVIIPLLIIGWATFARAGNYGFMAPRQDAVIAYLAKENTARAITTANPASPLKDPEAGLPDYYPHFNALVYTIDIFIPVFDLGQESTWEPVLEQHGKPHPESPLWRTVVGQSAEWTTGNAFCPSAKCAEPTPKETRYYFQRGLHRVLYWIEVVAGWVLGTLVLTGISGWMKKE